MRNGIAKSTSTGGVCCGGLLCRADRNGLCDRRRWRYGFADLAKAFEVEGHRLADELERLFTIRSSCDTSR